jgi:hypothetical protein
MGMLITLPTKENTSSIAAASGDRPSLEKEMVMSWKKTRSSSVGSTIKMSKKSPRQPVALKV